MIKNFLYGSLIILMVCTACSVKQNINLNLDSSGSVDLQVALQPVFVNYIFDIAEATTDIKSVKDIKIFDTQAIKTALEKQPGVTIEHVISPSQETLELKLKCSDLAALAASVSPDSKKSLLSFKNTGGTKEFRFYLDKSNYNDIKKLFPLLNEALFQNLEPQVDEEVTESEYLDIIEFAMEKEGKKAVQAAVIEVRIKVQGSIISQKGGTIKDGAINIKIPLLDVLLLNKPVEFTVKYK